MKKLFLIFPIMGIISAGAAADEAYDVARVAELTAVRDTLRADLAQIESEQSRCEKSKGTWKTVTIVGGVGAAATGIGALIQAGKIGKKEKELKQLQGR